MGEIKKILARKKLPPRELHNSRLFVDLAENVHIHFREWRTVYSVPEFFEFANTVTHSARDLKRYLRWHPQYREQEVFDTITVAMGPAQQTRPLTRSPNPGQSTYFDDRLQIELQAENVIDEIQIHYRDYRLAMNRETFRAFAHGMKEAIDTLDEFLENNTYERVEHPFRKEVVKDAYYEARAWHHLPGTRVRLGERVKAVLFRIGGEWLESLAVRAVGRARRMAGLKS